MSQTDRRTDGRTDIAYRVRAEGKDAEREQKRPVEVLWWRRWWEPAAATDDSFFCTHTYPSMWRHGLHV